MHATCKWYANATKQADKTHEMRMTLKPVRNCTVSDRIRQFAVLVAELALVANALRSAVLRRDLFVPIWTKDGYYTASHAGLEGCVSGQNIYLSVGHL